MDEWTEQTRLYRDERAKERDATKELAEIELKRIELETEYESKEKEHERKEKILERE